MKIVIDIPEDIFVSENFVKYFGVWSFKLQDTIENGIPLPKGHGRIGDLDKIKKEMQNYYDDCAKTSEYTRLGFETAMAVVEDAQIIIETDKEEEE